MGGNKALLPSGSLLCSQLCLLVDHDSKSSQTPEVLDGT